MFSVLLRLGFPEDVARMFDCDRAMLPQCYVPEAIAFYFPFTLGLKYIGPSRGRDPRVNVWQPHLLDLDRCRF